MSRLPWNEPEMMRTGHWAYITVPILAVIPFEVPNGHRVTSVQWQPGGAGSGTATWTL